MFTRHILKAGKWIIVVIVALISLNILYSVIRSAFRSPPPPVSSVTAESFRFESYEHTTGDPGENVAAALRHIFPPGTPKAYVDRILVQQDGASEDDRDLKKTLEVRYIYKGPKRLKYITLCLPGWSVYVKYDADLKLTWLNDLGLCFSP